MLRLPPLLLAAGWALLAAGSGTGAGPAPALVRCPPCTAERRARCPVPQGCEELVREPGCGCCGTCALAKGRLCGVYTARCGSGLRCYPRRGCSRPLHSLMRGRGVCMEAAEVELLRGSLPGTEAEDYWELEHADSPHIPCHAYDKKCISKHLARIREKTHTNGKSKTVHNHIRDEPRIKGPCQGELERALERFTMLLQADAQDSVPHPHPDAFGLWEETGALGENPAHSHGAGGARAGVLGDVGPVTAPCLQSFARVPPLPHADRSGLRGVSFALTTQRGPRVALGAARQGCRASTASVARPHLTNPNWCVFELGEETHACHPSLDGQQGKCWCVDVKTGVKLLGTPEVQGNIDCHHFLMGQGAGLRVGWGGGLVEPPTPAHPHPDTPCQQTAPE
ncbi:LOW QUALITY PROTEIN: insulin-like growth factor-binding protein 4 [Mobula birostris]|uniref:LOW QUALITY PROTEIN: insulin-like growth factor-binding protein 4 n=1 Tax=Mobula birostris TaxID=1983395 RepID=UPI003B2894EE